MTLILSSISRNCIVQTSDRLVVTQNYQPFDRQSNKSIVFEAPNAIVTMAYTGLAYLDGVPTDQWLADIISGCSWKDGALRLGKIPRWSHIGPTMTRIQKGLEKVFNSNRLTRIREAPFELVVVGWQWNRRMQSKPILGILQKKKILKSSKGKYSVKYPVTIQWASRRQAWRGVALGIPKGNLTSPGIRQILEQKAQSLTDIKMAHVNAIRYVSNREKTVGPDCMSVLMPTPRNKQVDITYYPKLKSSVIFSPCVIGRKVLQAPVQQSSGWTLQLDQFAVHMQEQPDAKKKSSKSYWLMPVKRPGEPN